MPLLFAPRLFGPQSVSGGSGSPPVAPTLRVRDLANGGGGVATISDSDPAATNTLWGQTYDPAFTIRPWVDLGSVVGDGDLSFNRPLGHWAFYVESSTSGGSSVSFVTYGGITDASRQSVQLQCLQAVAVRLKAMALPGLSSQSIVISELPWSRLFEGESPRLPMPGILVCPIGSERITFATNVRDDVGYPVLVSTLAKNDQELKTYLPRYTLWRQTIERGFRWGKLPGVQTVISMTIEPGTIVLPEPFTRTIWHSSLVVRCTSREPRGLGV